MPAEYGSKKQFGKQKTYGKPVKSHLAGWFGRNLWNEIEDLDSATKSKTTERVRQPAKEQPSVRSPKIDVNAEGGKDVAPLVGPPDRLVVAEEESAASVKAVEVEPSALAADDPNVPPQASSIKENSDKESAIRPNTNDVDAPTASAAQQETLKTPRSVVLGECSIPDAESAKESPPRKRGLRKRLSAASTGTGASSTLRNELPSEECGASQSEGPTKVWGDDIDDVIVVKKTVVTAVVEGHEEQKPLVNTEHQQNQEQKEITVAQLTPDISDHGGANVGGPEENGSCGLLAQQLDVIKEQEKEATAANSDASDSVLPELSGIIESSNSTAQGPATAAVSPETGQLLQLCSETKVLDFTTHIEALLQNSSVHKLGEASYSEVFLQTPASSDSSTVLKVIPFGQEEQCEAKSIVQEVRITKAMAKIEGFIGFQGAYVCRGHFPDLLTEKWDEYDEKFGSENERPDFYNEDQLFAIIMLENGGTDLEHTELKNWEEACDVFWQVALALAKGEREREFEHRDLHFGNIVIKRRKPAASAESPEVLLEGLSLRDGKARSQSSLKATLIDYTLSRARCGDFNGEGEVEFLPLDDPALFSGKGDYQFDIYRFMRNHLSSGMVPPDEECIDWNVYAPRTNVFWLHYLINLLLTKMGIPKPAARGRNAASETEKECFKTLEVVGKAIDPRKKRFGKPFTIESAGALVKWAAEEGFV